MNPANVFLEKESDAENKRRDLIASSTVNSKLIKDFTWNFCRPIFLSFERWQPLSSSPAPADALQI